MNSDMYVCEGGRITFEGSDVVLADYSSLPGDSSAGIIMFAKDRGAVASITGSSVNSAGFNVQFFTLFVQ